ncbi:MAG TPA: hypothetical protein VF244_07875 [Acidimicrobiales bacterium]
MSKREITKKQIVTVRPSLRELSPAELRLVVGGIPGIRGTGGGAGTYRP